MKRIISIFIFIILFNGEAISSEVWSGLGSGTDDDVLVLAASDNFIYAGGNFTSAGGVSSSCIARWEKSTSSWLPMDGGVNGDIPYIVSIIVKGNDIYVGGSFSTAGSDSISNIAKWSEITESWSPVGGGLDSAVNAMTIVDENLFVVGNFVTAGDTTASRVAKFNTLTSEWAALDSGIVGSQEEYVIVTSVVADSEAVYIGGQFSRADTIPANNIARWNLSTSKWEALIDSSTTDLVNGVDPMVLTLHTYGNHLYAGGWFANAGAQAVPNIAKWDGYSWQPIGSSIGVNGAQINDILILSPDRIFIAVMETFSYDGSVRKWNGTDWTKVDGFDPFGGVQSLQLSEDDIYVGGRFGYFGGDYAYIAKFEDPDDPYAFTRLSLTAYLEGAYNGNELDTLLNGSGSIPTNQPYNTPPWNYEGSEQVPIDDIEPINSIPDFFDNNPDIVDWILVELRSDVVPDTLITRKACFILSDGTIVDTNGNSPMLFTDFGEFYIVLYHRNHVPIMSNQKVLLE